MQLSLISSGELSMFLGACRLRRGHGHGSSHNKGTEMDMAEA